MKTILLLLCLISAVAHAQTPEAPKEPPKFYRFDFVVKDLEAGKVITAHNYSTIVASDETSKSEIRAGSKVPFESGANSSVSQIQLIDVGTNIDCLRAVESHDTISFEISAEVSSVTSEKESRPIIRQNKWYSHVTIPLKKPTIVFSSDDNTTKRVMQLEVTATPLKN